MKWQPVFEAIKEPLRLLVLALIPFGVVYFQGLSYEWAVLAVVVLRFLDKLLHEYGKVSESDNLTKGLTRF